MISNIQKIKKIGCFDEFENKGNRPFNKVNIFYGNNGSGKTTFSNILYLLSKHCKEKSLMLADLLEIDSEIEIETNTGKITQKNIVDANLDLYVFNSKFISDSVYNGNSSNIASFSNEIKLTNEAINVIDERLNLLKNRHKKLDDWNKLIQGKLDSIWKPLSEEFQSKISNARLTNIKPLITNKETGTLLLLKSELGTLYWKYDNIAKQSVTLSRLESFKKNISTIQNIELNLIETQEKLKSLVSTDAKGKISDKIKGLQDLIEAKNFNSAVGDLNDWYKKGGRLLHISKEINNHCPLCDTDLKVSIDGIITNYSNYFNDAILKLFDFIDNGVYQLDTFLKSNFISANTQIAKDIVETCPLYEIKITPLIFEQDILLKESINNVINLLKNKKQTPDEIFTLKSEDIELIESYIQLINTFKVNAIKEIDKEIEELKKKSIDTATKEIKDKLKLIASVELNEQSNNIFSSLRKSNSEIATKLNSIINILKPVISQLEINRNEEVAKLNAESKYMNIYLKHLGINHISIDKIKDKSTDNILITYLKTGKQKTKLIHALSEGEKTALAFAYFISKLRVEKIEGSKTEFENCIIVIDDPISSLDDNRLFQTANLIDTFLFYNKENEAKQPLQLFVLSHNLVFVKYLFNAFRSNTELANSINEYYMSNNVPYIRNLPSGLKNYTNTYISKLKSIIEYKDNAIDYDTVKNYLPNYIRIVLETFLAFKLALVKDSQDKLPGLNYLIKAMVKEFDNIEDKEFNDLNKDRVIERLNHLKKIADHESHGNIHKAEEFVFISEHELKEFAKHTIQVISYIDDFHFKKIKAHSV